jgi:hypothetical protein
MKMCKHIVLPCVVLYALSSLAADVSDREENVDTRQVVMLSDVRLRHELAVLIEDYARLSSVPNDSAQALHARLREARDAAALTDAERDEVIAILKSYTDRPDSLHAGKVERLLIALGDIETITNAVKVLSEGSPVEKLRIPEMLASSKQPAVVAALSDNLLLDESLRPRLVGGDVRVTPKSVSAMHVINQILAESDEFPAGVNAWARSLRTFKDAKQRELLRSWWNLNRDAMLSARYMDTRPLSEVEQNLQTSDLEPQRRPVRRLD